MTGPSAYGKGDQPRPFVRRAWDEGWDRAFGRLGDPCATCQDDACTHPCVDKMAYNSQEKQK